MDTTTTKICRYCNSSLRVNANFCTNCGNPVTNNNTVYDLPVPSYETNCSNSTYLTQYEKNWAMYCHLSTLIGWIIPFGDLILTMILWNNKKDTSEFINMHGKEALNYQITFYIWTTVFAMLACIWIGIPFLFLLVIVDVTIPIIASIKASNGEFYKYPLIFRFVK